MPRPDPSVAEFARGVKFTVNGYNGGEEVQTNFPVLVRISETGISGFHYSDFYADGSDISLVDIGFVDADGNGLAYEIDTWNTSGESLVWVNLPRMTNGTEFAMWYRSSKTGKELNANNAWAEYTGVWHLNESGSAGTAVKDSTTNILHGAAQGKSASVAAGQIGGSWRISDVWDRANAGIKIELDDAVKLAKVNGLGDTFSASFWMKRRDKETKWCVTGLNRRPDGSTAGWGTQIHDETAQLRVYSNGGKNIYTPTTKTTGFNTANRWEKIDVIWYNNNGVGKMIVYWNGANKVGGGELNPNTPVAQPSSDPLVIGNFSNATSDRAWSGELDEVRLFKGVPSAARVQADYDTVNTPAFLTAGSVVEVAVVERPVATLQVVDIGASHVQFGNAISSLGSSNATECVFNVKVWKTAESEPAGYMTLATGLAVGSLTGLVKGLTPATAYSYKLKVTNDENVDSDEVPGSFTTSGVAVSGTGGDVTRVSDDWIHYFRVGLDDEGGITNTYVFTPPSYATNVQALVVGGGGPGGYYNGGGGGAGGYIYDAALGVTGGTDYAISVGTGGVATATATAYGSKGGNSSITGSGVNLVAIGGGAGGNGKQNNQTATLAGQNGGSGGGTAWTGYATGSGTADQGHDGGDVPSGQYQQDLAAGGGGAASAGGSIEFSDKQQTKGSGVGGNGRSCDITGESHYYAGGGSGGAKAVITSNGTGTAGAGGAGGGGKGGQWDTNEGSQYATAGVDGFGGGGGGGSNYAADSYQGGDGGDGIVIIRYAAHGDPATVPAPIVSLKSATCNDATFRGEVTFRVAWAGYGYQDANVKIAWGYSKNHLVHTTDIIATNVIGYASGSFPLIADKCYVYCRAVAINGADISSESTETLSFYVAENENAQEDTSAPVISEVGILHVDALYAVVTGVVNSAGVSLSNPATCTIHVKVGSTENNLSSQTHATFGTGPFTINVTNLAENTTYCWNVEAIDDAGTSFETDSGSFTTIPKASVLATPTRTTDQLAFTVSGDLSVVGAGTTHVFVKWGDGEWAEVGTFNVESGDTSFSSTYTGTWDSSIVGYLVCSNECRLADGALAEAPYVTSMDWSFTPTDSATYTWQPVNGDWNGDWNDTAHWASDKADNLGYPQTATATASFLNCTLANPVTVNVNGRYTVKTLVYYGTAASAVTFAGISPAESSLSAGHSRGMKSNTSVEFRDMTLVREGYNWEFMRNVNVTNLLVRFTNVISTGNNEFSLSASFSRFEFVKSRVTGAVKVNLGGNKSTMVVDDSLLTSGGNFHFGADLSGTHGPMELVMRGKNAKITARSFFIYNNTGANGATVTFEVPEGGFAETPIQVSGANRFGVDDAANSVAKFAFAVSPDSRVLRKSCKKLGNMVMVNTAAGFDTAKIVDGIGVVPEHHGASCGEFKWGVGGAPLAEGAELSTARQILLDVQGWGGLASILIMQ